MLADIADDAEASDFWDKEYEQQLSRFNRDLVGELS
jgi:hypothetical protein